MKTLTYAKETEVTSLAQQIVAAGIAQATDPNTTATDEFFGTGGSGSGSTAQTFVYAPDTLSAASEATIDGVVAAYMPSPATPTVTQVSDAGVLFTKNATRTLVGNGIAVPANASLLLTANVIGSQNGTVASAAMIQGAFRNNGTGVVQAGTTTKTPTGDASAVVIDFAIGSDGLVYVAVTGLASTTISWWVAATGTVLV